MTDYFAVATVDEGINLRVNGRLKNPILMLGPAFSSEDDQIIEYGLTQTIFEPERARALNDNVNAFVAENIDRLKAMPYAFSDYKAHVHIAVDTGMSRIGLRPDESGVEIIKEILKLENVVIDGIFTHFAKADYADKTETIEAYKKFRAFKEMCISEGISIPIWHCANTAAIIDGIGIGDDMDMIRCGVGIYGMYPSEEVHSDKAELIPPVLWYSYITYIKEIEAGTSVSYGYTFTADRKMTIGTVCCGYADGYPRLLSNCGEVLINGKRCGILGNVCMDQFMIDLTGAEEAATGQPVVLMGFDGKDMITPEEIAEKCGTINYEITCGISHRVPRRYV